MVEGKREKLPIHGNSNQIISLLSLIQGKFNDEMTFLSTTSLCIYLAICGTQGINFINNFTCVVKVDQRPLNESMNLFFTSLSSFSSCNTSLKRHKYSEFLHLCSEQSRQLPQNNKTPSLKDNSKMSKLYSTWLLSIVFDANGY